MWLSEKLADFLHGTTYRDIPPTVRKKSRLAVADTLANCFGALRHEEPRDYLETARSLGGSPRSTVAGLSERVDAQNAAHFNALLTDVLQYQDILSPPTAHLYQFTTPAALAVAEAEEVTGKDLIAGVALGTELAVRLGLNLNYHLESEVFGFGWSAVSSAAAVAKILELDAERTAHALSLAAMNTPVPAVHKACSPNGNLHPPNELGAPSSVAVRSGYMARDGYPSALDVFDGEGNFARMVGAKDLDEEGLLGDLGEEWTASRPVFKHYPQCCLHFPADEAAEYMRERRELDPEDIESITVRTLSWISEMPFSDTEPENAIEATLSLPMGVACSILDIQPVWTWMDPEVIRDPEVRTLMSKVTVQGVQEFDEPFQENYQSLGAELIVNFRDGSSDTETVRLRLDARDDNRKFPSDLSGKFKAFFGRFLSEPDVTSFLEKIDTLDQVENVRDLTKPLLHVNLDRDDRAPEPAGREVEA